MDRKNGMLSYVVLCYLPLCDVGMWILCNLM